MKYTYSDSIAGKQTVEFPTLSELIKYIEDFGWHGDSSGIVFQGEREILYYDSFETGIFWNVPY